MHSIAIDSIARRRWNDDEGPRVLADRRRSMMYRCQPNKSKIKTEVSRIERLPVRLQASSFLAGPRISDSNSAHSSS